MVSIDVKKHHEPGHTILNSLWLKMTLRLVALISFLSGSHGAICVHHRQAFPRGYRASHKITPATGSGGCDHFERLWVCFLRAFGSHDTRYLYRLLAHTKESVLEKGSAKRWA
jgi:hypothetical protein